MHLCASVVRVFNSLQAYSLLRSSGGLYQSARDKCVPLLANICHSLDCNSQVFQTSVKALEGSCPSYAEVTNSMQCILCTFASCLPMHHVKPHMEPVLRTVLNMAVL